MENAVVGFGVKRMIKFEGDGTLRAICDLSIGEFFLVKGLRIVEGKNGLFVSMPRHQGKDAKWYDSVSPMTKEAREEITGIVLDAYHRGACDGQQGGASDSMA